VIYSQHQPRTVIADIRDGCAYIDFIRPGHCATLFVKDAEELHALALAVLRAVARPGVTVSIAGDGFQNAATAHTSGTQEGEG